MFKFIKTYKYEKLILNLKMGRVHASLLKDNIWYL